MYILGIPILKYGELLISAQKYSPHFSVGCRHKLCQIAVNLNSSRLGLKQFHRRFDVYPDRSIGAGAEVGLGANGLERINMILFIWFSFFTDLSLKLGKIERSNIFKQEPFDLLNKRAKILVSYHSYPVFKREIVQ